MYLSNKLCVIYRVFPFVLYTKYTDMEMLMQELILALIAGRESTEDKMKLGCRWIKYIFAETRYPHRFHGHDGTPLGFSHRDAGTFLILRNFKGRASKSRRGSSNAPFRPSGSAAAWGPACEELFPLPQERSELSVALEYMFLDSFPPLKDKSRKKWSGRWSISFSLFMMWNEAADGIVEFLIRRILG